MNTELQNNDTDVSFNPIEKVFSFRNIAICLFFIFSAFLFSITCLELFLMIFDSYFSTRSTEDMSGRLLSYYNGGKYIIPILFFWLTSTVIVENFLQKRMSNNSGAPKSFWVSFLLYFSFLVILVNVSFLVIDGSFVYLAREAGRCSGWCGIELYIFPFASLPFIAVFTLARYFLFISFEKGFFSNILLRFVQRTKFIAVSFLIMWSIIVLSSAFEYLVVKNNTKIILEEKKVVLQEKESRMRDQTAKLCESLDLSSEDKVLCHEDALVLSKIHLDAHLSFAGDSFESEMQKSKFRLLSDFISKINIPNEIKENAGTFSFSTISIDKDFPDLRGMSTAVSRFGGLYSSLAVHSTITHSGSTSTIDSIFYRGILIPFVNKHDPFRLQDSYSSTDNNGDVKESLSYTVYIPVEAFFNADGEYSSPYVFGAIKELVAIQDQFLKK